MNKTILTLSVAVLLTTACDTSRIRKVAATATTPGLDEVLPDADQEFKSGRFSPDGLSVAEVTRAALETWNREPLFHVSSPRDGHDAKDPRPHHDFIAPPDLPHEWFDLDLTVEVEAKAKEVAVARLRQHLLGKRVALLPLTGASPTSAL